MKSCCFVLLVIAFGCVRVAAADFPAAFLEQLPHIEVNESNVASALLERLAKIDDIEQRVRVMTSLGRLTQSPEHNAGFKRLVEKTIDAGDASQLYSFGSVVAYFPALHDKLLEKFDEPRLRDIVRSLYAQKVTDFDLARRISGEINRPDRRRIALNSLIHRAPSLEEELRLVEESLSFRAKGEARNYYPISLLQKHAAEAPRVLCDFVERVVPADSSIGTYAYFASRCYQDNPAAAKMYMDAAWSRLPDTTKPHAHAARLLARDYRDFDRGTWVAKFDQFVLPALRDGETGVSCLAELARFDIDLMIDRTRQSSVHPARSFEEILPAVMQRAYPAYSEAVLSWLENTDSKLKDPCILEIVTSLPAQFEEPAQESFLKRLCDLALAIEEPQQRLDALGTISAELPRLGVTVPERVIKQGRVLLQEHSDFNSIDLRNIYETQLFWLGTHDERRRLIETHLERFRDAEDYQDQLGFAALGRYISESGLAPMSQLVLFREMASIAKGHSNRYLQAKIASSTVKIDAALAIKMIWSILPDDRGRSGKRYYIDWIPPPYDAGDAIRWLQPKVSLTGLDVDVAVALWEFLPTAPQEDRDSVQFALCQTLTKHRHFEGALGLSRRIESPLYRAKALVSLLAKMKTTAQADQP